MSFNSRRLASARRRRGLTKRELARRLGVSERIVTHYEAGGKEPSPQTLDRITSVLGFPMAFYERPDLPNIPGEGATFRALSRMTAAKRERALVGGELGIELSNWVDAQFELPGVNVPDLRYTGDPESAAEALRSRWGLSDAPISHMVRLLESKGVRVFSLAEEGNEIDAFSFWGEHRPFVFLNTMKSSERSRFDAAHELGHLVLHRHGELGGRAAEVDADRFASAFLMPESSILASGPWLPTLEMLVKAKHGWKVSVSALAHRLHSLRLISAWHYRVLCIEIQQAGYRQLEPETEAREMSQVFEKMFDTFRSEGLSKADIAERLAWPVSELSALVFGLVMTVHQSTERSEQIFATEPRQSLMLAGVNGGTHHFLRGPFEMGKNDRTVSRRDDGSWANKRDGAERAGSKHPTQADAAAAARRMLEQSGGGELKIKGLDGKIRSKDTIAPGNDPNPPKDKEH